MAWKFLFFASVFLVDGKGLREPHLHDPKTAFENLARIGNEELARMRAAAAKKDTEAQADNKLQFLKDIRFGY